ncbi:hypothetical protein C8R44DRAFT_748485 [Mycena epipterygia]|nr:hypothetical protein C8R44DRAFT_748485 [Mycena epipterygia]
MVRVHLAIMCWPIGPLDLVAAAQGVRQGRAAWAALGHPAEDDQTLRTFEKKGVNFQMQAGRLKVAKFAPSELAAELTGAEFSHNTRCGPAGASAHQGLVPLGCGEQHQCNQGYLRWIPFASRNLGATDQLFFDAPRVPPSVGTDVRPFGIHALSPQTPVGVLGLSKPFFAE